MSESIAFETAVLLLFVGMLVWTQAERAGSPGYHSRNPRTQIRWLSIVFVLLSLGFGSMLYSVAPLLALALAAGFTISLIHPANALCLFVHMLFMRPWEIITTNPLLLALPRLLATVCFISWLLYPGKCGKPTAGTLRVLMLLLGFGLWLYLSTFRASGVAAAQTDFFDTFFKSVIVFVMCLYFIDDERSVLELRRTIVLSILALMVMGFYGFFFRPPDALAGGRLSSFGMGANSNDLAAAVVIALPLALVPAFGPAANVVQRMGGLLFLAISLAAVWYTQSRGAMLGVIAEVLAFGVLFKNRGRNIRILVMAGILLPAFFLAQRAMTRSSEDMSASQENRVTYWKAAVEMTLRNPVLGVGFDQYLVNYNSYSSARRDAGDVQTAHSSWFLAFAESGIPGGLLFMAFFITVFAIAWRNRRQWPEQLYALLGYGVVISFLSHTYLMHLYLLAGLILASESLKERSVVGI